jgi:hypothetical protein
MTDQQAQDIIELLEDISKYTRNIIDVKDNTDYIDKGLQRLETKLGYIDDTLSSIKDKIDDIDLSDIDNRLGRIESMLENINNRD